MQHDDPTRTALKRVPWNKGKLTGAKAPLRPKNVWSIRTKLQVEGRVRERRNVQCGKQQQVGGLRCGGDKDGRRSTTGPRLDPSPQAEEKDGTAGYVRTDRSDPPVDGRVRQGKLQEAGRFPIRQS